MGDMTLIFSWPGGMLARGYDSPFMKYSADLREGAHYVGENAVNQHAAVLLSEVFDTADGEASHNAAGFAEEGVK